MASKELIYKWKGNQRYTMRMLDAMPDETFDFKPAEGMKTFKSQASHIATWLRTNFRHLQGAELEKAPTKSKEEISLALQSFFDALLDYLQQAPPEELATPVKMWYGKVSKESLLSTMDNHLSHHRGQMVVYLRLQGIQPPSYIGW